MPPPSTGLKRTYSARQSYDEGQEAASTASGQPLARGDPTQSEALNSPFLDDFDEVNTVRMHLNIGLNDNNLDRLPPPSFPSSPPSPLTPLEELGDGGSEFRGWRNQLKNEYHLFEGEDLSGPEEFYEWPKPLDPEESFLGKKERQFKAKVVRAIFDSWPNSKVEAEAAQRCKNSLVDHCAFWHKILYAVFRAEACKSQNSLEKQEGWDGRIHVGLKLLDRVRKQVDVFSPFKSPLVEAFFNSFKDYVGTKNGRVPADLKEALRDSDDLRKELDLALELGTTCSKRAKWIGLERSNGDCTEQMRKHMVETKELYDIGINSGALPKEAENVLLLKPLEDSNEWRRICAPEEGCTKMFPLVFWNKARPKDRPTWDKQFGAVVYNPAGLSRKFCKRDSGGLKTECRGLYEAVRNKTSCKRAIEDQGVLVKYSGAQSTFGAFSQGNIRIDTTTAINPGPEVVQRIEEQKQLRIDLDHETSSIQASSFAFMLGFLPHLAHQQYREAKEYGLINDLGRPNVSSFAAFAYSAGLHRDNDICASHGWVFQRPKEISRHESNFVYGDYKLIVELAHDAHWWWDASNDAHGTTSNQLAMKNPVIWKDMIVTKPESAQWTTAQTIPKRVANAAHNHPQPEPGVW